MNIIPDSFHSLLAPDLQRYIALKQLLGRCFDTSSKVFFELDRFLWGLGKPPADLTPETFPEVVSHSGAPLSKHQTGSNARRQALLPLSSADSSRLLCP